MNTININPILQHNIKLTREDAEFRNCEKAMVADALYGIKFAKEELEDNTEIIEKLDVAIDVVMSYLFHIDMFIKE